MRPYGEKGIHTFPQSCHLSPSFGVCRIGEIYLFRGWPNAVCYSVSRQENRNAFAATSIPRQSVSRSTGEKRSLYSGDGLPRDPFLPCQWIFSPDEQQEQQSPSEPDSTAIDPGMEREPSGSLLSYALNLDLSSGDGRLSRYFSHLRRPATGCRNA